MFVGTKDELADLVDNRWAKTQLNTIVHYKEYDIGHMGFFVAKDFTYFTEDAMSVLSKYHPANNVAQTFL